METGPLLGSSRRLQRAAGGFVRRALAAAGVVLAFVLPPLGCSSSSPSRPQCDPAACPAGNDCIDDGSGKGPRCLPACTRQDQCSSGSFCNDGQPKSWCVPRTVTVASQPTGQWGYPCLPSDGESDNPACDQAQGFRCYATNPNDGAAFCTYYNCYNDSDCKGGMWCAEVNAAPNATTATRSLGGDNTHFWCLPRSYCAPCVLDHDCPRGADGTQQHCLADANGAGFCAPQCTGNDSCALDAICTPSPWGVCAPAACQTDTDCQAGAVAEQCVRGSCRAACAADADCPTSNGIAQHCALGVCSPPACESDDDCPVSPAGFFQHCNQGVCAPECGSAGDCDPDEQCADYSMCKPRAGVCVGDGSFCSPCHSDFDCPNGYCLAGQYSGERFCSQTMAAGTSCSATTPPAAGACPARPADANYKGVSCTTAPSNFAPANECIGVVSLAGQFVPGCWTVNQ